MKGVGARWAQFPETQIADKSTSLQIRPVQSKFVDETLFDAD